MENTMVKMNGFIMFVFVASLLFFNYSCYNLSTEKNIHLMDQSTYQSFLLNYLSDRYAKEFVINKLERSTNESSTKKNNTITAYISPADQKEKEFNIFFNDNPKLEVKEDRYPFLLLEEYLTENTNFNIKEPYVISPKLSSINLDFVKEIKNLDDVAEKFKSQTNSFWYLYMSIIPSDLNLSPYDIEMNKLIKALQNKNLDNLYLEIIFYKPDINTRIEDLKYDANANFGKRYKNENEIIERWIGQFTASNKEELSFKKIKK